MPTVHKQEKRSAAKGDGEKEIEIVKEDVEVKVFTTDLQGNDEDDGDDAASIEAMKQEQMSTKRRNRRRRKLAPSIQGETESEDGSEEEGLEDDGSAKEEENEHAGFADAMSKILSQSINKETPVLAKRKTEQMKLLEEDTQEKKKLKKDLQARREKYAVGNFDPDPLAREAELGLKKVATRGVIALFNAISKHQKSETGSQAKKVEAGKSARGRFMQTLQESKEKAIGKVELRPADTKANEEASSVSENGTVPGNTRNKLNAKKAEKNDTVNKKGSGWKVLEDNYLMGAKMKDWDKEEENVAFEGAQGVDDEFWND